MKYTIISLITQLSQTIENNKLIKLQNYLNKTRQTQVSVQIMGMYLMVIRFYLQRRWTTMHHGWWIFALPHEQPTIFSSEKSTFCTSQ